MPSEPSPGAPTRFRDLTLAGLVDEMASSAPVPGGGSASAIAASLAAGLVAMVAALSEGRPKYAEHAPTHASAGAAGRTLADRLLQLADDDAASYAVFAAALRMPRATESEQAARTTAMRAAARAASVVPLECVEACRAVIEAAHALAGRSNLNASSDLGVASLLAAAAAHGAGANVLVNLPAVADASFSTEMSGRVATLLSEIDELSRVTREVVASGELRAALAGGA
ncbi:MAG: cyclodeaminase/cyclohydrolase family protein [Candidatus Limnocylindrales bacterium]